jgi:hypothetical protein
LGRGCIVMLSIRVAGVEFQPSHEDALAPA